MNQILFAAFGGAAAISFLVTQWHIWVYTEGPEWMLAVPVLAYVGGLVAWTGSWRRPFEALGALLAAAMGLFVGYVLAILVANLASTGPTI